MKTIIAASAEAMGALGGKVAAALTAPVVIFLSGPLAAGKTTFARGFLHARGHRGPVKSPTFTLVESYCCRGRDIHHFDLYRIADPEELLYVGIEDYFDGLADCLVEWPARGADLLPKPDCEIDIAIVGQTRQLAIRPRSSEMSSLIKTLNKLFIN